MGFLNLLRVPEPVDRRVSRLARLGRLRPLSKWKGITMNSGKLTQRKISNGRKWRKFLQPRRRPHDPMLVFNMSLFNFEPAWNRVFSPLKQRENVWP
jgi:hypothetical protein